MHKLSKAVKQAIQHDIEQVMQEKTLHVDAKVLLVGMAISLNSWQFQQILDRVYVMAAKICLPLKNINDAAQAGTKNAELIQAAVLDIISYKTEKINCTHLEQQLLQVHPDSSWRQAKKPTPKH